MPIYVYEVLDKKGQPTGETFEIVQSMKEEALTEQPKTGKPVRRAVLAPNINLARSPLAGRAFEYFSEDPLLAGVLGAAWIGGLQSTGAVSVAKHLVCNDSETARDTVDVQVDEGGVRGGHRRPS